MELYLFDEDRDDQADAVKEATRLILSLSDWTVKEAGLGNVAGETAETTRLRSVLMVRPISESWDDEANMEGVMSISFPTDDEEFVKTIAESDIEELKTA
jgi:hypothetical protein